MDSSSVRMAHKDLGEALHDPSEEKWNIDATSSYHAMIKSPCTKTASR